MMSTRRFVLLPVKVARGDSGENVHVGQGTPKGL